MACAIYRRRNFLNFNTGLNKIEWKTRKIEFSNFNTFLFGNKF